MQINKFTIVFWALLSLLSSLQRYCSFFCVFFVRPLFESGLIFSKFFHVESVCAQVFLGSDGVATSPFWIQNFEPVMIKCTSCWPSMAAASIIWALLTIWVSFFQCSYFFLLLRKPKCHLPQSLSEWVFCLTAVFSFTWPFVITTES